MNDRDVLEAFFPGGATMRAPKGWSLSRYRNLERRGLITIREFEHDIDGRSFEVELTTDGLLLFKKKSLDNAMSSESNPIMTDEFHRGVRDAVKEAVETANEHGLPKAYLEGSETGLDEKKERAEFEATEHGSDLTVLQGLDFAGQYADPNVQNRWIGWLRAKQAVAAQWVTV